MRSRVIRSAATVAPLVLAVAVLFLAQTAFGAWSGPTESPTGGNVDAPVHIGTASQVKNGSLGVNTLAVYGTQVVVNPSGDANSTSSLVLSGRSRFGYDGARASAVMSDNNVAGKNLVFDTNGSERMRIESAGDVGIGTTNPNYKLEVVGRVAANLSAGTGSTGRDAWHTIISSDNTQAVFTCDRSGASNCDGFLLWSQDRGNNADMTGGIFYGSSFLYSSDARLKEGVVSLKEGLKKIMALNPVSFIWKDGRKDGERDIGFIAQEVEKIIPEVVHENGEHMKNIDYAKLVPVLVQAIQEQQGEIEALKKEVESLKSK